ncbi:MAG: hypothetical protein JWQ18_1132 [Conexibacter sp.]|nr:hypothetical protein [Conexibacter sp.]
MTPPERDPVVPYERLFAERRPSPEDWDSFVRDALVPLWLNAYDAATPWATQVLEIPQGSLTFLFDMAPSMGDVGDDRVVAVWGRSVAAAGVRDKARQAGFIPVPEKWSKAGYDRGHFVSHAAGGGMDMNFFPQAKGLNRGHGERGGPWRALERETVARPGTPLLVRPTYDGDSWVPEYIDYCIVVDGQLRAERFHNRD